MDLKPKPVASAMEKPLRAAPYKSRLKTEPHEMFLNGFVNLFTVDAATDYPEGDFLGLFDRHKHFFKSQGRLAADDSARKVCVVTRRIIAWENIHHNRLMSKERTGPTVMGVNGLSTARDNRMLARTTIL